MKLSTISIGALAAVVTAQDLSSLAPCGQTCANDMLSADKAEELGCDEGDFRCLCLNENFTYGLRDCSIAVCSDNQGQVQRVVEYGISFCSSAGVEITTTGPTGGATATSTSGTGGAGSVTTILSTTPIATSTIGGSDTTSETGGSGGGAGGLVTTITTDGSTITSTMTTPTSGGGAGGMVTTITTDGSTITSTMTMSTSGGGGGGGAGGDENDGSGGEATSTDTDDAAPQMTAAPAVLAAAGLLAIFL